MYIDFLTIITHLYSTCTIIIIIIIIALFL